MNELKLAQPLEPRPLLATNLNRGLIFQGDMEDLLQADNEVEDDVLNPPRPHAGMFFGGFILVITNFALLLYWNRFFNPGSAFQLIPLALTFAGMGSIITSNRFGRDNENAARARERLERALEEVDLGAAIGLGQELGRVGAGAVLGADETLVGAGAAAGVFTEPSSNQIKRHFLNLTKAQKQSIVLALGYSDTDTSGTVINIKTQLQEIDLRSLDGRVELPKLLNHIFAEEIQESEEAKKSLKVELEMKLGEKAVTNLSGEIKQTSLKEFSQVTHKAFIGNPIEGLINQVYYYSCFYKALKSQLQNKDLAEDLAIFKELFQAYLLKALPIVKALPIDLIIQEKVASFFWEEGIPSSITATSTTTLRNRLPPRT